MLDQILDNLSEQCLKQNQLITTAESCTGGLVAKLITDRAGSSQWFERGFVTYSNQAKTDMLGVDTALINQWGAVSEPVAAAMAEGALQHSQAQYALAITGIAGPGGGSAEKPVGLVWFAWSCWQANDSISTITEQQIFAGDRQEVRTQAATFALQHLLPLLLNNSD